MRLRFWALTITAVVSIVFLPARSISQNAAPMAGAPVSQTGIASSTPDEIAADHALIERFAQSHDPADLQKAFDPLATVLRSNGGDHPPAHQIIMLWLKLFSVVDAVHLEMSKELGPAFLCDDGAYPDGSTPDGPCGPPPSTVNDPELRSQYETAISQNESAIRSHNNYARISTIEQQLDASFWTWANGLYHSCPDSEAKLLEETRAARDVPKLALNGSAT